MCNFSNVKHQTAAENGLLAGTLQFCYGRYDVDQQLVNFSAKKGQIVNTSSFTDRMVFAATIQICYCSTKAARDNTEMNECDCVLLEDNFQKKVNS